MLQIDFCRFLIFPRVLSSLQHPGYCKSYNRTVQCFYILFEYSEQEHMLVIITAGLVLTQHMQPAPCPLWAPSIVIITNGKPLAYTQVVLSDYQNSGYSTVLNKKCMHMSSPLFFRRRPDSFSLSVVSAVHSLEQHLEMASCLLSPFYQNLLNANLPLGL